MQLGRICRHIALPDWWVRRRISKASLHAIKKAVAASETMHRGELRFVFEATLPLSEVWSGRPIRERALDAFSDLRVWDTENNSGVLIYIELLDRRVEIIADRGINACVDKDFWETVCRRMEAAFSHGEFEAGCLAALKEITVMLATHYPVAEASNPNELSDRPALR